MLKHPGGMPGPFLSLLRNRSWWWLLTLEAIARSPTRKMMGSFAGILGQRSPRLMSLGEECARAGGHADELTATDVSERSPQKCWAPRGCTTATWSRCSWRNPGGAAEPHCVTRFTDAARANSPGNLSSPKSLASGICWDLSSAGFFAEG